MEKEKLFENATIEISHVGRKFPVPGGSFEALKDIDVTIPEGKLTILKGKSGSGKTTLMNIIGALDKPTSGKVLIGGRDIQKLSERQRDNLRRIEMGFVFQAVSLIPSLNAFQNVEYSLRLAGIKKDRKARVEECLKMVGLGNRMNHMPAEMSGGEQQRVAIARAIAHRPRIILADEPTAELDSATAAEVTRLLGDLTRKEGVTIIMTTHDTGLMDAGDMTIELQSGRQTAVEAKDAERMEAKATTAKEPKENKVKGVIENAVVGKEGKTAQETEENVVVGTEGNAAKEREENAVVEKGLEEL